MALLESHVWLTLSFQDGAWSIDLHGLPDRVNRILALFIYDDTLPDWFSFGALGYFSMGFFPPEEPEQETESALELAPAPRRLRTSHVIHLVRW